MSNFNYKSIKSDLALGLSLLLFFSLATLSFYLRPIADDYCVASFATFGFSNHFRFVTMNLSGDYTQILFSYVLVAKPIAFGPDYLVGLVTLLLLFFLLTLAVVRVFNFLLQEKLFDINKKAFISLSALLLITWCIYWALPASLNTFGKYKALLSANESFSAVFGWPTVIVQYLIVPLVLSLLAMQLEKMGAISPIGYALFGFFVGTSGYAIALAVFVALPTLIILKTFTLRPINFFVIEVGILVGVYLSFFSQGAQKRSELLLNSESTENYVPLSRSIFVSLVELFVSIFNLGTITVFFLVYLFIRFLPHGKINFKSKDTRNRTVAGFSVFLIVYYLVISASEYFTYQAFWHLITFKMLLFIYIVLLAIILAIRGQHNYLAKPTLGKCSSTALFSLLLITLSAATQPFQSIFVRGHIWAEQSAPLPGISDIYPRGGWVDSCWVNLREFKGWEDRRYDPV
jgi:hypothetical protein